MKMGRAAALLVGYVSIQICALLAPLPTAHFDRNESHVIYGTGHLEQAAPGQVHFTFGP